MNRIVTVVFTLIALAAGCAAGPADTDGPVAFERFVDGDYYLELYGTSDVEMMDGFGDIEVAYFDGNEEVVVVLSEDTGPEALDALRARIDPALAQDLEGIALAYETDGGELERGLARAAYERLNDRD